MVHVAGAAVGDAISSLPVGQIGAGSLVALVVLLILNGRLVTRQALVDLRADLDKWRATAETWQAVATQNGVTLAQHGETLAQLIEYARTTDHAITSIQAAAQGHPQ